MSLPGRSTGPVAKADDAGAPLHHWLVAVMLGGLFGGVGVLVNWVVLRALT